METKQLDNWKRLTSYLEQTPFSRFGSPVENMTKVYDSLELEVLDINNNYFHNYIEPFTKELLNNIFENESTNGKRDVIKYYISNFLSFNTNFFTKGYNKLKDDNTFGFRDYRLEPYITIGENDENVILTKHETYFMCLFNIMDEIFEEIQNYCHIFNISFFDICDEIGFKCFAIYCGTSYDVLLSAYQTGDSIINTAYEPEGEEIENVKSKELKAILKKKNIKTPKKIFSNYFRFKYPDEFVEKIKIEFKNAHGKPLALLTEVLLKTKELKLIKGEKSSFIEAMQDFFGWDIGARSTILHQRSRFNVEEYNDIAKRIMKIKEQITQSKSQNS